MVTAKDTPLALWFSYLVIYSLGVSNNKIFLSSNVLNFLDITKKQYE